MERGRERGKEGGGDVVMLMLRMGIEGRGWNVYRWGEREGGRRGCSVCRESTEWAQQNTHPHPSHHLYLVLCRLQCGPEGLNKQLVVQYIKASGPHAPSYGHAPMRAPRTPMRTPCTPMRAPCLKLFKGGILLTFNGSFQSNISCHFTYQLIDFANRNLT